MKLFKLNRTLLLFFSLIFWASCAKEIIDLTGDIKGVVKDADDGHLIENCLVTLTPGNTSQTTGLGGGFEFVGLTPGDYTLTFKKVGYPDFTQKVSVVTGEVKNVDVLLKAKEPFAISESTLDFGDFSTNKDFFLYNNSDMEMSYEITNIPTWLTLSRTQGSIKTASSVTIKATIDRNNVDYGSYAQNMVVSYKGRSEGDVFLAVKFEKVHLSRPKVSCAEEADNVTETSFDIEGYLESTGGSVVLQHGHCWSVNENPTIDDKRTTLGQRSETGVFVSSISGLTTNTTYYVRAYAENEQGIIYSDQVVITTQDAYSDKWDGKIASEYAGGSGTKQDPFIIKNGGQLLYAIKQGDGYLKLANNIDLNNHNWKPFDFRGSLDGNGYVISNLRVERDDISYRGLIGVNEGTVKNLTIRGVVIKGDNAGAIAGYHRTGGVIDNCKVILSKGSVLQGTENVGGLIGYLKNGNADMQLTNCIVESTDDAATIQGVQSVGGLIGYSHNSNSNTYELIINQCKVFCNVVGEQYIGGVIGFSSGNQQIYSSEYKGDLLGSEYVGGIYGCLASYSYVVGCKSVANIEAEEYVGGIVGDGTHTSAIASYADGSIDCKNRYVGGIGYGISSELCYSTVVCANKNFYPISPSNTNCYSVYDSNDIAQSLEEAYSDYANYWNFDNTWTWTGIVDGKQKSVKCPKLFWE